MSPIIEATYYSVKCDDCATSSGDLDDYSAWAERDYAVELWTDADQWSDGEFFLCELHAPRCPECGGGQYLSAEDMADLNGYCEDCAEVQP